MIGDEKNAGGVGTALGAGALLLFLVIFTPGPVFSSPAAGYSPHAPLAAWADSVISGTEPGRMTLDEIKGILSRETGEPVIEGTRWQRKKNARVAMLCSLFFPGLGQFYNEKPVKALIALGFQSYYLTKVMVNYRNERRASRLRDSYPKWVTIEVPGQDPVVILNRDWRYQDAWLEEYKARKIDWVWWSVGTFFVIMLDSYIDAHLHDMRFRVEDLPVPEATGLSLVVDF
ncbi:MAG: hypothetical protein JXB45_02645 [Candidatus Krumholzibacteriota bacterium]|nr:hypothetical protein [Candidatus Krumholzibacteriota bacterium]